MGFPEPIRLLVLERANYTCCWCKDAEKKVEIHHIVPQAEGGPDTEENGAPLCSNCHTLYGGNPELRKEIRLRRDNWYRLCNKSYVLVRQEDMQALLQHVKLRQQDELRRELRSPVPTEIIGGSNNDTWRQVYSLDLPAEPTEPASSQALKGWRFAYNSSNPRISVYPNAVLGIGNIDNTTANCSPDSNLENCRVECDIQIMEYGHEPSNWAGIRIRGLFEDLRIGYLVFLRADGRLDVHRGQDIIATVRTNINPCEQWTKLTIEIIESILMVRANGIPQITLRDKWFGGNGGIFLHTFGTHSLFRNFRTCALNNNEYP
jgi:hypothetical protein